MNEASKYAPMVEEAVGLLGYEVRFGTRKRGAVALELIELHEEGFIGRRLVDEGCYRAAWAVPVYPQNIAHEVAHTLGLEHVDAKGNLMRQGSTPDAVDLMPKQSATLDHNVRKLGGC